MVKKPNILFITSDMQRGDCFGAFEARKARHSLYLKGPMPYDGLLWVGLVVMGPGISAGHVVDDPVSTLDLAATFYDWAGIEKPEDVKSDSLRSMIEGKQGVSRDVAYSEWKMFSELPEPVGIY